MQPMNATLNIAREKEGHSDKLDKCPAEMRIRPFIKTNIQGVPE